MVKVAVTFEWVVSLVLLANVGFLGWLIRDYYKLRTVIIPGLIARSDCAACHRSIADGIESANQRVRDDLGEIKTDLKEWAEKTNLQAVSLGRICQHLGIDCGR